MIKHRWPLILILGLGIASGPVASQEAPCGDLRADLNGDCIVDLTDFFLFADQFGATCDCPEVDLAITDLQAEVLFVSVDDITVRFAVTVRSNLPTPVTLRQLRVQLHSDLQWVLLDCDDLFLRVDPSEAQQVVSVCTLPKPTGTKSISGTILMDDDVATVAQEQFSVSVPRVAFGDSIQGLGDGNLTIKFLSWRESDAAVRGPYGSGFYTFTAQPGFKFIVLLVEFLNESNRGQRTPYIDSGELVTDTDNIYSLWSPPGGVNADEYAPRPSNEDEIATLAGDSGAYETLLPGERVRGGLVFEIPADLRPVEADLSSVFPLVVFE